MSSTDFAAATSFLVARPYSTGASQRPNRGEWCGTVDGVVGGLPTGFAANPASLMSNGTTSAHLTATIAIKRRDPGALGALT